MSLRNLTPSLLFFGIILITSTGFGQSITGNVASSESADKLGYATVNIYQGSTLVANVLSDASGNFNVKLDTGTYKCEILYAGFKKTTREIKVKADEKADFSMDEDGTGLHAVVIRAASRKDHTLAESYELSSPIGGAGAYSYSWSAGGMAGKAAYSRAWGILPKSDSASHGRLTAGEINDFSKWNLWTDLTSGELNDFQRIWQFAPSNRYTVQLTDKNGLPLANGKVELMSGAAVIYTSRSDNTGKAELWGSLLSDTALSSRDVSIRVTYNGQTQTVNKAKSFDKKINTIVFDTRCVQSQNVDIAIVVDATGSMQDEIDYLKYDLNDVIYQSKEFSTTLNLHFANIFYRDLGDAYVTRTKNFTSVLSESVAFVNQHNADGGGDGPEAVEIALDSAINKFAWRDDTRAKILLLVLDAPPHNTPTIQAKMRRLSQQAAEKGIRIVPVVGSGSDKSTEYLMRCIALATNGSYVFLTDHGGIGDSHIKPSTDNYEVEVLNDLLTRVIKSYTYMPDCQQYVADLGLTLPDSVVVLATPGDSNAVGGVDSIELKWSFYPNPTNGIVNIVSSHEIKELYITDLSGKVVQILRSVKPEIVTTADLSNYASGIYLIRYPVGKQWVSGRVALIR